MFNVTFVRDSVAKETLFVFEIKQEDRTFLDFGKLNVWPAIEIYVHSSVPSLKKVLSIDEYGFKAVMPGNTKESIERNYVLLREAVADTLCRRSFSKFKTTLVQYEGASRSVKALWRSLQIAPDDTILGIRTKLYNLFRGSKREISAETGYLLILSEYIPQGSFAHREVIQRIMKAETELLGLLELLILRRTCEHKPGQQ